MHNVIGIGITLVDSIGIIVIGCFYFAAPRRILGSFGLKPPSPDPDSIAWLRLKGVRDIAAGTSVITMLLTTNLRSAGILFLVLAIIPFGDMSNILISGGRKKTAFLVHGITCLSMILGGLLLIRAL